ncbi:hypothetical protein [Janthinobacterium agaricidamnosum]|uniref:hypothetical protein n=1 Tax=Janthinobacterium agaricidamnosum TaxID=55508 RepID=UPI000A6504D1|nr:hypothetical protein [Janthinobacterium agaricidamnosum]
MGLLATLGEQLDQRQLEKVMVETGRRLARENNIPSSTDFEQNLAQAMAIVDGLGANTEAVVEEGAVVVRNYSCPVAGAVRATPCVCKAIAAYFAEATGRPVTEECLRSDRLICQYRIMDS